MITSKFALDFTTAVLDGRVTFARTTDATQPATYINSSGTIVFATDNQPRFDYSPLTLQCKGLLIEESRTNQITYSSDFSQSAWTKTEMNLGGSIVSPVQSINATKIVPSTTNAAHWMRNLSSVTAGKTYAKSVIAKAAENTVLQLAFSSGFTSTYFQNFDLSDGTLGSASGVTGTIVPLGDGWYLCSAASNAATTTTGAVAIAVVPTKTSARFAAFAGDGTSGLYVVEAQLEAGAFATSRIPTTTTPLTRNADVAIITGTNFSDFWQATRGGVLVRARPGTVSGIRPWLQFDDGTANEIIALRGNTTNPELYIVDGGAPQAQIDAGTIAANTDYSLTGWWATNDCKARLDSGAVVTDTSATIPTVTQARLGSDGTNYLNGHLASISYYDSFSEQIYTRRKNKAVFNLM